MGTHSTGYVDARSAAIYLKPCTPKHLNEHLGVFLERKTANRPGTRTARSGGWLYAEHDLERVRAIMNALGCKPLKAAWLFHAIKVLEGRGLIPELVQQKPEPEAREARKFQ